MGAERLEEELVEMIVPASEVDPRGPPETRVFVASRKPDVAAPAWGAWLGF